MKTFRFFFVIGMLSFVVVGCCGHGQNGTPPTWTGEAAVGTVTSIPSPIPGQTGWPCTVQVYTAAGGSTPTTTSGLCGSGAAGAPMPAPSGAIACQVTLPNGSAATGWCLPGASSSPTATPVAQSVPAGVNSPVPTASTGSIASPVPLLGAITVTPSSISISGGVGATTVISVSDGNAGGQPFVVNSADTGVVTVNNGSCTASPCSVTLTEVSVGSTTIRVLDQNGDAQSTSVTAQ